jgi:hypothetical protein
MVEVLCVFRANDPRETADFDKIRRFPGRGTMACTTTRAASRSRRMLEFDSFGTLPRFHLKKIP